MTQPIAQCATAQEALDFIRDNASGGPILVLAPDVLEQIQAAEAQGGFEGGMSGDSGVSAEGDAGPNASFDTDPGLDLEGAVTSEAIAHVVEGIFHMASSVAEAAHWVAERGVGPVVIVPIEELKKLAGLATPDGA
jgi:hypothetical protein